MTYFVTTAGRGWLGGKRSNREGRARLGPDPGPPLERHLPSHCPGRPRPACPTGIAPITLSIAETAQVAGLARQYTTGLISRARPRLRAGPSSGGGTRPSPGWHHDNARLLAITRTR